MDKILTALLPIWEKLTAGRVVLFGAMMTIILGSYIIFDQKEYIGQKFLTNQVIGTAKLTAVSPPSQRAIDLFMIKYQGQVGMLSVLSLDLGSNTRRSIYRAFNDRWIQQLVENEVRRGNDGSLPIFIRDNIGSNNQMISLIQGEFSCSPGKEGGLAKAYPVLEGRIVMSCRVPIPPAFGGGGARGYIAAHFITKMNSEALETLKLELMTLAMYIFNTDVVGERSVKMLS